MPELALFAVALAALLLLFGFGLFVAVIELFIPKSKIPILGTVLNWLRAIPEAAYHNLQRSFNSYISPLAAFIRWLWQAHSATNTTAQRYAAANNIKLKELANHRIPAAERSAVAQAEAGLSGLATTINGKLTALQATLTHAITQVRTQALDDLNTDVHRLNHELSTITSELAATIHSVTASIRQTLITSINFVLQTTAVAEVAIDTRLATLATDLDADVRTINAEIAGNVAALKTEITAVQTAAVTQTIQTLNVQASGAVAGLWPGIATPATSARKGIIDEYPNTITGSSAIPAIAPVTLAGSLAAVATMAATAVTYVDECGIPLCQGLGTLSKELGTLESLFADGIILAFLAWAIKSPTSAADATADVIETVIDLGVDLYESTIGAL